MKTNNVLIVGGSSSIGGAIVAKFHSPSTNIITSYFKKKDCKFDDDTQALALDLTSDASIENFVTAVKSTIPHIHTAIFLAGILPGKSLREYDIADIENVMTVNFSGQVKLIKRLLPLFIQGSHIIMISSISAQRGSYDPIYAASKGAILSFVKSFAGGPEKIRINAIAPGLIQDSTMYNEMTQARQELHRQQTFQKKLLSAADLAGVIYDISQDHWKHLDGACIDLNGGQYVR